MPVDLVWVTVSALLCGYAEFVALSPLPPNPEADSLGP